MIRRAIVGILARSKGLKALVVTWLDAPNDETRRMSWLLWCRYWRHGRAATDSEFAALADECGVAWEDVC